MALAGLSVVVNETGGEGKLHQGCLFPGAPVVHNYSHCRAGGSLQVPVKKGPHLSIPPKKNEHLFLPNKCSESPVFLRKSGSQHRTPLCLPLHV